MRLRLFGGTPPAATMPLIDPVTMSSATQKTSQAHGASSTKEGQALPQPIQINTSSISQTIRFAHPALLLAIFLYRFNDLVAEPVASMGSSLALVTVIQATYAVVCLPVAGSQSKTRKVRPGEKKKPSADGAGPNVLVAALLSTILSLLVAPLFHVAMILFGAPVLTHTLHTFLCAAHLSVLTLLPLFYVHGADSAAWLAVAGFRAPFDETFGGFVGGVVGAWLGAIPIPLDWDREWQKWPVTILYGIYAGYAFGKSVGGTLVFGKTF